MLCPDCGAALADDFAACPYCGAGLSPPLPPDTASISEDAFAHALFRFAPITTLILVVNVILFIQMERLGDSEDQLTLLLFGAKLRAAALGGDYWRLLTADFLHIGIWHLLLNSITLIQLGVLCENIYGRARFFILYILTGISGFLASAVFTDTLSAGASASLFGLMGATLTFGWRHGPEIPRAFRPYFTWYLLPWVVAMIVLGLFYGGIDNLAHIGGLVSGVALALILQNQILPEPSTRRFGLLATLVALFTLAFTADSAWRAWQEGRAHYAVLEQGVADQTGEIEVLSRFIDAGPDSGLYYFLRAQAQYEAKRFDAAEADYRRALSERYDPPTVKNAIAWLLITTGESSRPRLDEAVRLARDAVQAEREAAYLNTLGWALFLRGDVQPAIIQLEAAFKLNDGPEGALDLYMLAMAYHRKGDREQAKRKLEQARTLEGELETPNLEVERFRAEAEAMLKTP